jgi:hypothetical protein
MALLSDDAPAASLVDDLATEQVLARGRREHRPILSTIWKAGG